MKEKEQEVRPNEKHKSSVFSLLFSNPDTLRELYSAIEGVNLPPDIPVSINTISNALVKGKINDVSFIIDNRLVVIIEHQSTINENMPLRIFNYIQKIYEKIIDFEKVYKEKRIKIPKPEFIVLYNGEKPYPEKNELKLSDAFMSIEELRIDNNRLTLELIVQVYNINHGYNSEILQKCETLNNYSIFIDKIREYQRNGFTLDKSIEPVVKYCIENNILKDFLKKHGSEVINMLFYDYDLDTHLKVRYDEGLEDGIEIGLEKGLEKTARNLLAEGSSPEFIQKITGLPLNEIFNL
jgi:hypothetical protein